jgi:hypothetical protein
VTGGIARVAAAREKVKKRDRGNKDSLQNSPTLTEVRPSSSDALLPPPALLLMLMRLLLRGAGRTMALSGRGGRLPGDAGGEVAIVGGARWERATRLF